LLTREELKSQLFQCVPENYKGDFVAAAVQLDETGTAIHAGMLISCKEGVYLCHFDAANVLIEDEMPDSWYFFKIFEFIDPRLSLAFLGHCMLIKETSNPVMGFYYDGSFYDENGMYFSETVKKEFMTCVGFCINVIKGFINSETDRELFEYEDWTNADLPEWYLGQFIQKLKLIHPDVDVDHIKENIRRIRPAEYLAGAYMEETPIKRKDVAAILDVLLDLLKEKRAKNI